ncbi:MAG: hypothetical protein J5996_01225, partial [Prevotella sp.]|nr:hypothetical protein [Prevotella sp.]
ISDMRDETDLSGLKLAIDLKRGTDPDKLMAKLFRLTPLSLLGDGLETVLFFSRPELSALSSSGVRTLQMFGKDTSKFLP